jgi:hypothetical protein
MGKRSFGNTNWTPTATADTSALANATYQALKGASGTARNEVLEVYMAGMVASTSSPTFMQLAYSSTIATTPTALAAPAYDGVIDPSAVTGATVTFTAAAAGPQRSAVVTQPRLNLGINAWGGIVRWVAANREEFIIYGATATGGEAILSAFTGGTVGALNSHIIYEVV